MFWVSVCRELCIAGVGVARNYLHPGERDGDRFVQWSSKWAAIMGAQAEGLYVYRTGDEARRDSRGWLELCGRRDQHVKVGRASVLTSMRSVWRRQSEFVCLLLNDGGSSHAIRFTDSA